MCHNSQLHLTISIVRVIALAIILMVVFGWINMAWRPNNVGTGAAGASRNAIKANATNGAGRGCGCNGGNDYYYKHHDHNKYYRHHHEHSSSSCTLPVPIDQPLAYVRLVHATPDVKTPLSVTVDGTVVFENIVPGSVTKYIPVTNASVTLGLLSNGVQVATVPVNLPIPVGALNAPLFTVAAVPTNSPLRGVPPISIKTIADPVINQVMGAGSGVRFYHLSPTAPNVDIYANNQRLFSNVSYGTEVFAPVPAGTYSVAVVPTGKPLTESTIVYKNDSVTVPANSTLSIFAEGTDKLSVVTATSMQ